MITLSITYRILGLVCLLPVIRIQASAIDQIFQHNIILCTGPSYGRKDLLIKTTQRDAQLIPFKKVFIATNDYNNLDIAFKDLSSSILYFNPLGKQLDCLNCIILSIQLAINDPCCSDDDIIIFKHESVYISDMNLIRKAVEKLLNGYEIVSKFWIGFDTQPREPGYYHTDSFFITVRAAKRLFPHLEPVVALCSDYRFCEEFFTKYIVNQCNKVYTIPYLHSSWKDNELGFYHIPRYEENPNWYWDKMNYDDLYK